MEDDEAFIADGRLIGISYPYIGRKRTSELYTRMINKDYRPCYEKGRIRPGMETLPFGYREMGSRRRRRNSSQSSPIPRPAQPSADISALPQPRHSGQQTLDLTGVEGCSSWTDNDYSDRYYL